MNRHDEMNKVINDLNNCVNFLATPVANLLFLNPTTILDVLCE